MDKEIINLFLKENGPDELIDVTIEAVNNFQKTMEDNKKAIKILENSIKEKGWEVKWIKINEGIEYIARKENYDICTRSHLAEGDIYQEELGRLIALTRLFKVVYKFEGENDG
jgi:hypothetical protein